MSWTLANAKDHFSEVVRRSIDQGPQEITVRGEPTALVVSVEDWRRLQDPNRPRNLNEFLKSMPPLEDLDLTRNPLPSRVIDFE